ncbi:hypothetical protein REPUB_Repub14bG0034300 [Reevesia pubescens]
MSSQSTSQNIANKAGETVGQAQIKKDEIMDQASRGQANSQFSDQNSTYTSQATNILAQTGEQVKNMAQGAADAVKNTLGMNNAPNPNPSTNHLSNPTPRT